VKLVKEVVIAISWLEGCAAVGRTRVANDYGAFAPIGSPSAAKSAHLTVHDHVLNVRRELCPCPNAWEFAHFDDVLVKGVAIRDLLSRQLSAQSFTVENVIRAGSTGLCGITIM
jgi:hypothetical protein